MCVWTVLYAAIETSLTLFPCNAPTQDLNGYLVLKGAVTKQHVSELNAVLDEMPLETMQPGDWWGRVHGHS